MKRRRFAVMSMMTLTLMAALAGLARSADEVERRLLYVAVPGIRNYLEFGGHGVLVFDIDDGHKLLRRIPIGGLGPDGQPLNIKGVCASAVTGLLHVTTPKTLMCLDLKTDALLWEKTIEAGCDRMSATPDGATLYVPSFEQDHWKVIDARSGAEKGRITPKSGSHNTVVGLDGRFAYLAGLRSPLLTVADTSTMKAVRTVGPFAQSIRPFTVNGRQTLAFVCVNDLLGFEVGDIVTGKKIARVEVPGHSVGAVKRHGCPSHGIGLTPDEKEVWVVDAHNQKLHLFDATTMPPAYLRSLDVRDEPGWVTFTIRGDLAYPSTGEVFDVATRRIVARLADEAGRPVMSEKMVEVDMKGRDPVRTGDQFGLGRSVP
jgi:DNA-binding beta-propeller fold protein YncE